jgi:hypothetical protein
MEREMRFFAHWKGKKVTKPFYTEWRPPHAAAAAQSKQVTYDTVAHTVAQREAASKVAEPRAKYAMDQGATNPTIFYRIRAVRP